MSCINMLLHEYLVHEWMSNRIRCKTFFFALASNYSVPQVGPFLLLCSNLWTHSHYLYHCGATVKHLGQHQLSYNRHYQPSQSIQYQSSYRSHQQPPSLNPAGPGPGLDFSSAVDLEPRSRSSKAFIHLILLHYIVFVFSLFLSFWLCKTFTAIKSNSF